MDRNVTWTDLYFFWITVGTLLVGAVYATVRVTLYLERNRQKNCDNENEKAKPGG